MRRGFLCLCILVTLALLGCGGGNGDSGEAGGQGGSYQANFTIVQQLQQYAGYDDPYGAPVYVWKDSHSTSYTKLCSLGGSVAVEEYPGTLSLASGPDGKITVTWKVETSSTNYVLTANVSPGAGQAVSGKVNASTGKMYMKVALTQL